MAELADIIRLLAENQRKSDERMAAMLTQLLGNRANSQSAALSTIYKDLSSRMNSFTFCPKENLIINQSSIKSSSGSSSWKCDPKAYARRNM